MNACMHLGRTLPHFHVMSFDLDSLSWLISGHTDQNNLWLLLLKRIVKAE